MSTVNVNSNPNSLWAWNYITTGPNNRDVFLFQVSPAPPSTPPPPPVSAICPPCVSPPPAAPPLSATLQWSPTIRVRIVGQVNGCSSDTVPIAIDPPPPNPEVDPLSFPGDFYTDCNEISEDQQVITPISVRAVYDYEAKQDDELSFHVDDIITNVTKHKRGWWTGDFGGKKQLYFPFNFVEEVSPQPESDIIVIQDDSAEDEPLSPHKELCAQEHKPSEGEMIFAAIVNTKFECHDPATAALERNLDKNYQKHSSIITQKSKSCNTGTRITAVNPQFPTVLKFNDNQCSGNHASCSQNLNLTPSKSVAPKKKNFVQKRMSSPPQKISCPPNKMACVKNGLEIASNRTPAEIYERTLRSGQKTSLIADVNPQFHVVPKLGNNPGSDNHVSCSQPINPTPSTSDAPKTENFSQKRKSSLPQNKVCPPKTKTRVKKSLENATNNTPANFIPAVRRSGRFRILQGPTTSMPDELSPIRIERVFSLNDEQQQYVVNDEQQQYVVNDEQQQYVVNDEQQQYVVNDEQQQYVVNDEQQQCVGPEENHIFSEEPKYLYNGSPHTFKLDKIVLGYSASKPETALFLCKVLEVNDLVVFKYADIVDKYASKLCEYYEELMPKTINIDSKEHIPKKEVYESVLRMKEEFPLIKIECIDYQMSDDDADVETNPEINEDSWRTVF